MGLDKSEIIMVGDRVSTDVKGAQDFGIRALLVKTGEFRQEHLYLRVKPDYILDSVRALLTIL